VGVNGRNYSKIKVLELIETNSNSLQDVYHLFDDEVLEWFPLIHQKSFTRYIYRFFKIVINDVVVGLGFMGNPPLMFMNYGKHDFSIIIFKQYRSRGFGMLVIEEVLNHFPEIFFIVNHKNIKMLNLLDKTNLLRNDDGKYVVFYRLNNLGLVGNNDV
jgi:ribosomal protein S18 acetylase RimI-like enzyme